MSTNQHNNTKIRILAIIGIVLLVILYISTIFAAFTASSNSSGLFLASIGATILIPTLIWIYTFIYKLLADKKARDNMGDTDISDANIEDNK